MAEEFSFIEKYTLIEKKRFDEKLDIHFSISEETLSAKLPTMILQPIIENAIKHGVLNKKGKGEVQVSCEKIGDSLLIIVSDDGPGIQFDKTTNRVGLNNTEERLRHLYSEKAKMELKNKETGGLKVSIAIPFENI